MTERPSGAPEDPAGPLEESQETSETPTESLEDIRAAWRAERASGLGGLPDPAGDFHDPTAAGGSRGFGAGASEKWNARKGLYIVAGIALVASFINPGLTTVAILAGVAYWTADKLLAPEGRAADAPEGSGFRRAHELWQAIGLAGRIAASVVLGVLLGLLTGSLSW